MAKAKKKTTTVKRTAPKKSVKHKTHRKHLFNNNPSGTGVYWYGIHVHHIGLGVAAAGTLVLVLALINGVI